MQPRAGLPTAVLLAFLHHSFVLKPRGLFWGPGFACAGCWASRGASRWRRVQERGGIRPASPALTRVRLPLCPAGSTPRLGRKGAAGGRAPSLRAPVLGQMAVAVLHLTCAGSCGRCGGLRRAAAQTALFAVSRPGGAWERGVGRAGSSELGEGGPQTSLLASGGLPAVFGVPWLVEASPRFSSHLRLRSPVCVPVSKLPVRRTQSRRMGPASSRVTRRDERHLQSLVSGSSARAGEGREHPGGRAACAPSVLARSAAAPCPSCRPGPCRVGRSARITRSGTQLGCPPGASGLRAPAPSRSFSREPPWCSSGAGHFPHVQGWTAHHPHSAAPPGH